MTAVPGPRTVPGPVVGATTAMRVDVEGAGEDLVVVVSGEVDSMTAPGLRESLAEVLARPGAVRVVVDLAAVTFLDSAGLCALAAAHRDVRSTGRTLLLRAGDNRAVLRPLQITGLWDVLGHTAD